MKNYCYGSWDYDRSAKYKIPKEGIEVLPNNSHKSFYNKCYYVYSNGIYYLYSYKTCVYKYDTNIDTLVYSDYGDYSRTTDRHIRAFVISLILFINDRQA